MINKEIKREYDLRDITNKPKEEKYNFWKIYGKNREDLPLKLNRRLNEKIKKLFQEILNHELSQKYYYNKIKIRNLKTCLYQVEMKMNKGKYYSKLF